MSFKNKNRIIQELEKNNLCYVLITCTEVSGKMFAELDYEGDTLLASYLLQKAQLHIDEKDDKEDKIEKGSRICSFHNG